MSKKLISLLLIVVLFTTAVLGSYAEEKSDSHSFRDIIRNKGFKAEAIMAEGAKEKDSSDKTENSDQWQEYVGDIETFVYGLIINNLEYSFDVFPACIDLSDGNEVFGIAYTDYADCYTNEDESFCCFEAGFIPFNGELPVPQEDFDSGLNIINLDFTDENTSFIWVYGSDPIRQHCVVYNQYLQYGIDDGGTIFYEASEYVPGICDESIGSLYSFDEAKYLFDIDVGEYVGINGVSLYSYIDFDELEKEINRILQTQDLNFAEVDVVSCAYFAQEAVISYLLSLQEETFLGYSVSDLVEAANELDPLECYRITADGIDVLKLEEGMPASDTMKWVVGSVCVIVTALAMVGSVVFFECPPLSALAGSVAGTAIEMFMEVVIHNKDLSSVDWRKVALSAVAGAVSGYLGPYIYAACGGEGIAYFALDSSIDGFIGAIERAADKWMDGGDATEVISAFGVGYAMGFVLSAGFKALSAGISKLGPKLGPGIKKIAGKFVPAKLANKVSAAKKSIGNWLNNLKKAADDSIFHSKYISQKIANKQLQRLTSKDVDELMDQSMKTLGVDNMVDVKGNELTKEALKSIAADAKDGAILGYFKKGDDLIQIVKKNSAISIVFPSKYQTVAVPGGLTDNRSVNFEEVAKILKKQWLDDPSLIPESLALAIRNSGKELEDLMPNTLVNIIQGSDWVIHENIDKLTATLVPRVIHEEVRHMGGVALEKYLKSHFGKEFFDRLVSAAATDIVIVGN